MLASLRNRYLCECQSPCFHSVDLSHLSTNSVLELLEFPFKFLAVHGGETGPKERRRGLESNFPGCDFLWITIGAQFGEYMFDINFMYQEH